MRTIKEFEYHLWAVEENGAKRYFARVKETGEETEVSLEVMRVLLAEEKRMRREKLKRMEIGGVLSTDQISEDETSEHWLADPYDLEKDVMTDMVWKEFFETLTDFQKQIYECCMMGDMSYPEFAKKKGVDKSTIYEARDAIRKKFKKIF